MRKQKKIRKEDIGDPSNFVHVEHVGFSGKKSSLLSVHNQRSFDLGENRDSVGEISGGSVSGGTSPAIITTDEDNKGIPVERRSRGSRSSLIPRHHRSTTTCIFPENAHLLQHHVSTPPPAFSSKRDTLSPDSEKGSLKPTFGSLLNLSFLPLGLGKSSQSSGKGGGGLSTGKNKRLSLLNLTASNLFSPNPKGQPKEEPQVQMTGYTRRRSFSSSDSKEGSLDESGGNGTLKKQQKQSSIGNTGAGGSGKKKLAPAPPPKEKENSNSSSTPPESKKPSPAAVSTAASPSISNSTRIPLSKLGRSKSTMSEFTKRPKLRLKIVPPVVAPPPIPKPPRKQNNKLLQPPEHAEGETLPSPPPSPLPSPPTTPTSAPPMPPAPPTLEEELLAESKLVTLRKIPKSPPRSRIIPLPSTPSVDSLDFSPQYLTPAGGSSPMPQNEGSSAFPLLSPTIPPSSTPLFSTAQRNPHTPPVWPLQPLWPVTSAPLQQTEPTIPEVPSPSKEEMDIAENEYNPVASLVDSFLNPEDAHADSTFGSSDKANRESLQRFSSALLSNVSSQEIPYIIQKLFNSMQIEKREGGNDSNNRKGCIGASCFKTSRVLELQSEILKKSLELWMEVNNGKAKIEELTKIVYPESSKTSKSN